MNNGAKSGWIRPESETVIAFAILFLLFTAGGYLVWYHRRLFMRSAMAVVLFVVAGINGFGLGLWVIDKLGIDDPYSSEPSSMMVDRIVDERDIQFESPPPTEISIPGMTPF